MRPLRAEDRRRADRRARSTSCRPARRCARTTTRPTRSGCSSSGRADASAIPTARTCSGPATSRPSRPARRARTRRPTAATRPRGCMMLSTQRPPAVRVYPDSDKIGVWTGDARRARAGPRVGEHARLLRRRAVLEEGLALAAVGRDGVDDLAAARPGARRRSARTARPPWRGGTTRGRRPAAPRRRRAAASAPRRRPRGASSLRPGGQDRARQPVAPARRPTPGSRRRARWRRAPTGLRTTGSANSAAGRGRERAVGVEQRRPVAGPSRPRPRSPPARPRCARSSPSRRR